MPRRDHVLELAHQVQQFSEAALSREQRQIAESEREFKSFEKRILIISRDSRPGRGRAHYVWRAIA